MSERLNTMWIQSKVVVERKLIHRLVGNMVDGMKVNGILRRDI
jgi:hypothetical protein